MNRIQRSDLRNRAEFGIFDYCEYDVNNQRTKRFNAKSERWFSYREQTLNQQYTLEGLKIKNSMLIAIRHDDSIEEGMFCKIGEKIYRIVTIMYGEGLGTNVYDQLTLQRVTKRGETYDKGES